MISDLLMMALKGSIAVIYLFFVVKILGKKQISELNIFDYIIGLSLGNIAAEMTVNEQISILGGLVSMSVYGSFSLLVSYLAEKSLKARRFFTGFPVVIMRNGKISFLPKAKYNPLTPSDIKVKVNENSLTANLVIDGNIMQDNLKEIGHDKDWLLKRLDKEGYKDVTNLLLVVCNNKEQLTIYPKDENIFKSVLE